MKMQPSELQQIGQRAFALEMSHTPWLSPTIFSSLILQCDMSHVTCTECVTLYIKPGTTAHAREWGCGTNTWRHGAWSLSRILLVLRFNKPAECVNISRVILRESVWAKQKPRRRSLLYFDGSRRLNFTSSSSTCALALTRARVRARTGGCTSLSALSHKYSWQNTSMKIKTLSPEG